MLYVWVVCVFACVTIVYVSLFLSVLRKCISCMCHVRVCRVYGLVCVFCICVSCVSVRMRMCVTSVMCVVEALSCVCLLFVCIDFVGVVLVFVCV